MTKLNKKSQHILAIEDTQGQRIITLNNDMYSLGRSSSNSIVIYDRQVSRYHATLLRQKHVNSQKYSFWIVDGDLQGRKSTNGVLVNGKYCSYHKLEVGDSICFGDRSTARYYQFSGKTVELIKSGRKMGKPIISKVSMQKEDAKKTLIS